MSWVCCDALNPAGCPDPEALWAAGADGVRIVAFDDEAFFSYAEELLAVGFEVGVVLARESFDDDDFAGWASYYGQHIHPTLWVVGNEMDAYLLAAESPSSWKMPPEEYAFGLWHPVVNTIRPIQPDAHFVTGGLVSGQPSYLDELLPLLDPPPWGVDVHPYGREAQSAEDLFWLYRSVVLPVARERFAQYQAVLAAHGFQKRLLCLEWSRPAEEIADYERMLAAETGEAAWFCWSNQMVAGFGLVDEGVPTAEGIAWQEANTMTAIDERAQQLGVDTLGEPLGPEVTLQAGVTMRPYYNAVLVNIPGAGVYALAEATVASKFRPSSG